jgi:choline transport protein
VKNKHGLGSPNAGPNCPIGGSVQFSPQCYSNSSFSFSKRGRSCFTVLVHISEVVASRVCMAHATPMALDEKISSSDVEAKSATADALPVYDETVFGGNTGDIADMQRLGKKQEFKRSFGFLATLGFISIYMATWEFVLVSLGLNLINGGFGGLFWTFLLTTLCYSSIVASLAELESMAPTSGGQYHWVSEFAPESSQKFLSYVAGWMSTLGWLASVASSTFVVATLVEVLVILTRDPDFAFPAWQYVLLTFAFTFVTIFFNTWGAKSLPALETFSLFGHIAGFFVVFIALWATCPRNTAHQVFVEVIDNGGWSNGGVACLVGQSAVIYTNLGSDSAVHISEEVEDASLVVPRAMWWSFVANVFFGILMLVTMLFCIGPLDDAIASTAPYLNLFANTGSTGVAVLLSIIIFLLIFAGNITALATCSREVWAFSRDNGLPFSHWIAKMNHKAAVPYNSVYVVSFFSCVILCINFGSTFAFNIIVSMSLLALLSTYMISIGCVLLKRIRGEPLPHARWSLGRAGIFINGFAFIYSAFAIVWSSFPPALPAVVTTTNWGPAVWFGVLLLSIVLYFVYGKHHYTPPVMYVEGRRAEGVAFQSTD